MEILFLNNLTLVFCLRDTIIELGLPAPSQDMKFTLRAAKFDTSASGAVTLTNDTLPSLTLGKNPLVMTNGNTALKVNHFDHQMHSTANNVTISGVKSGAETTLNGAISSSVTTITLTSGTNFDDTSGKFSRNASNVYFIKIGDEVISYTSISGNVITGATRICRGNCTMHTLMVRQWNYICYTKFHLQKSIKHTQQLGIQQQTTILLRSQQHLLLLVVVILNLVELSLRQLKMQCMM